MRKLLILIASISFALSSYAAIPKGDSLIIDGTSGVLSCSSAKNCQMDPKQDTVASNITYVMPDYMGFTGLPAKDATLSTLTSYDTCTKNQKPGTNLVINVSKSLWGTVIDPPMIASCVNGSVINQTLAGAGFRVVPMFSGSAYEINGVTAKSTNTEQVQMLAKFIAKVINSDPNIAGVAFDLEGPSLGHTGSMASAETFVTTLANALDPNPKYGSQKRFMAIFDGEKVMNSLFEQGTLPSNVVLMHAMYDSGECYDPNRQNSPGKALEACPVNGPGGYMEHGATGDLLHPVPVMYVLPAAATTQLFESVEVYNTSIDQRYINIKHPKATLANMPYQDLQHQQCQMQLESNNTSYQERICTPQQYPTQDDPKYTCVVPSSESTVSDFMNACKRYDNPTRHKAYGSTDESIPLQVDYFNASLDKLIKPTPNNPNVMYINSPNVIGLALYNVKPAIGVNSPLFNGSNSTISFNTIAGAKAYWNTDATLSMLKYKVAVFPETISYDVWEAFNNFRTKNPIQPGNTLR